MFEDTKRKEGKKAITAARKSVGESLGHKSYRLPR